MQAYRTFIAAAAVLLAGAGGASAQSFYAGAYGGGNFAHESDVTINGVSGTTVSMNTGYAAGGFAGYDFGNGFRLEGELAYRKNGLDELSVGGSSVAMEGDVVTLALMVNGLYDFDTGSALTPHIGAGAGMAKFSLLDAAIVGNPTENNDDMVFAYQFIAGAGYDLSPTVTLFADYRLLGTTNPEFTNDIGEDIEVTNLNSTVLIGIATRF
jgi:opacity protein-like surface antigen